MKNIKYIQPDFMNFLREFTSLLCSRNCSVEQLSNLLKNYKVNKYTALLRAISYMYSKPHAIWYFNKRLNNITDISKYTYDDIIHSISFIMKANNMNGNNIVYLKSKDQKNDDQKSIMEKLKEYYSNNSISIPSSNDLSSLYSLYLHIGKKPTIPEVQTHDIEQDVDNFVKSTRLRKLSNELLTFENQIKSECKKRHECQQCKLFGNPIVVLDTNLDTFGPVDIVFIGLNPGINEKTFNKPMVGEAGKYLRRKMAKFPVNVKWMITNILLCYTNNQNEIGNNKNIKDTIGRCRGNLKKILSKFPSSLYVPTGSYAAEAFGIKGSIIENSGQIFKAKNNIKIVPIPHPSGARMYKGKNEEEFNRGFEIIYKLLNNRHLDIEGKEITKNDYEYQNDKNTTFKSYEIENKSGLYSFNIVNLDKTRFLYIYIDSNGKKHYEIKEPKIPVYINENTDWKNCPNFTNEHMKKLELTHLERNILKKELKTQLEEEKKRVM